MGLDNAVEEEMPEPTLVNAQIVDGVVDILSGYNYHDALAASNAQASGAGRQGGRSDRGGRRGDRRPRRDNK